ESLEPDENKTKTEVKSKFVREAMSAAVTIQDQIAKGERNVDIPQVLREEKFVEKLTKHGLARKALQRLDLLMRLQTMINKAIETVLQEIPPADRQGFEAIEDIDEQVATLAPFGLAKALPLGEVRPSWAMVQSWWDLDNDRDLLIGSFLHGYGAYAKMRTDPQLCFSAKIREYLQKHPDMEGVSGDGGTVDGDHSAHASHSTETVIRGARRSSHAGVYSQPGSTRWIALNHQDDKDVYLGTFNNEVDAAKVYDEAVRKQWETNKAKREAESLKGMNRDNEKATEHVNEGRGNAG
ncbi:unnamed protein product, partial [Discosporangium mesarthrocarpum]